MSIYNVTDDYNWTSSKNRNEVPSVMMIEYKINTGWLATAMLYYASQPGAVNALFGGAAGAGLGYVAGRGLDSAIASRIPGINATFTEGLTYFGAAVGGLGGVSTQNDEPYKSLYRATRTDNTYKFPYLSSDKFSRNNTFQEYTKVFSTLKELATRIAPGTTANQSDRPTTTQSAHQAILALTSSMAALAGTIDTISEGTADILAPQKYASTTENDYSFSFDLINTIGDENHIIKNRNLAFDLTNANSPFKRNFAITDPVCIYEAYCQDVFYFPACYVSSLDIKNLGNTRLLTVGDKSRVIPEAYRFTITLKSLLPPSQNIMAHLNNNNFNMGVINTQAGPGWDGVSDFIDYIKEIGTAGNNTFKSLIDDIEAWAQSFKLPGT